MPYILRTVLTLLKIKVLYWHWWLHEEHPLNMSIAQKVLQIKVFLTVRFVFFFLLTVYSKVLGGTLNGSSTVSLWKLPFWIFNLNGSTGAKKEPLFLRVQKNLLWNETVAWILKVPLRGNFELRPLGVAMGNIVSVTRVWSIHTKTQLHSKKVQVWARTTQGS